MDLRLTRRGDYAVRAALALASAWGDSGDRYLKTRDIAAEMDLPLSYTPQVLRLLATAELAEAKAGPGGGYRLRRPPGDTTLLAVVEAADGPFELVRCILRGGPCRWRGVCAVHAAWAGVVAACRREMAETTLADLVATDERLRSQGLPVGRGAAPTHSGMVNVQSGGRGSV